MSVFLVVAYSSKELIYDELETLEPGQFVRIKPGTWFVSFGKSADWLSDRLGIYSGKSGLGLIVEVKNYIGHMECGAWNWLIERVRDGEADRAENATFDFMYLVLAETGESEIANTIKTLPAEDVFRVRARDAWLIGYRGSVAELAAHLGVGRATAPGMVVAVDDFAGRMQDEIWQWMTAWQRRER